ncbi:hypothetical protein Deba_2074 [Desulfarculus baarsii DSM 2075]|uniref:AlgX/AlgJ SGNH hydrolase-like domain-containing protein n=2 Tax=Desulfarculus baarsii TaxID=453230 RepID=E1QIC2_DESB2|nr:hypothetical protein Deba_2074 [Desulfarculus baarsii DSM 2075]
MGFMGIGIQTAFSGALLGLLIYCLRIVLNYPAMFDWPRAVLLMIFGGMAGPVVFFGLYFAACRLPLIWGLRAAWLLRRWGGGALRGLLLTLCLALLILPLFNTALENWFDVRFAKNDQNVLYGVYSEKKPPAFRWAGLLDGSLQNQFGQYFNNSFSLRPILIKLNNQFYYSVFAKSYMYDDAIVVGKKRWLYEEAYIRFQQNIANQTHIAHIERYAKQLRELQDLLRKRGVTFLLLISPSKATTYPEYIPEQFHWFSRPGQLNQQMLMPLLDKYGVNYYDAQATALRWRDKAPATLFCQGGTHWNDLGAIYALQGMLAKLEKISGKKLTRLRLDGVDIDNKPIGFDRDLAELLNLYYQPYDFPTPHPKVTPLRDAATFTGDLALVGGSFNWIILNLLHKYGVFDTMDFYYYFRTAFRSYHAGREPAPQSKIDVWTMDWDARIFNKDFVIVEMNSAVIPFGNYVSAFARGARQNDK